MPYRKQKTRLLAGSLNLLPPGDVIPPPDSLALTNWRVDQAGNLRSRRGCNTLVTGLAGTVRALYRKGENRYGQAGTALLYGTYLNQTLATGLDEGYPTGLMAYQDFVWCMNRAKQLKMWDEAPGTALNWGVAAPASPPAVSAEAVVSVPIVGFDSSETWTVQRWIDGVMTEDPLYEDILYNAGTVRATDESVDVQGTGTEWLPALVGKWIRIHTPDGPVVRQIAMVWGAAYLTLTTNFEGLSGEEYEYEIYDSPVESKQFLGGGTYLQLACSPAGRWALRHVFPWPKDLTIGAQPGNEEDDDVFRFRVSCEDAAAIDSLKVTLRAGDRAVTCSVPVSILNPAKDSWNQISITRRFDPQRLVEANPDYQDVIRRMAAAQDAGDMVEWETLNQRKTHLYDEVLAKTPHFVELTTPQGSVYDFAWNAVTEVWFEVENNVPTVVNFNDADMIGGPDGTFEGEWRFCYTFENQVGHESNPSDFSGAVNLRKQAPTVFMPSSTEPQVTKCHVYGIGGVLQTPLRFGTKNSNGGSLTIDHKNSCWTVEEAQDQNITVPTDHDPPPAGEGLAGPYFGRMLTWVGNRLFWSKVAEPYCWPGADDDAEGNWVDVGDQGDSILAVTCHKRMAIIYKQRSIWRLVGDPDEADPEQTNAGAGLLGRRAIVNAGVVDYFAAAEGIYRFNGDFEEKVSVKVDPIFKGDWVYLDGATPVKPIDGQYAGNAVMGFINGRLYFSYPETGITMPNVTLVLDTEAQRWYKDSRGFCAMNYEGQGQRFVGSICTFGGAPYGANLYEVEREATDGGATIPVYWQSAFSDQGLPNNRKLYADLVVDYKSASALTVAMVYDNATTEAAGTLQSTGRTTAVFPLGSEHKGRRAINAAVRITGDVTSEAVIYNVYLHWYAEARRGKTFDTGVTDLGTAQPKQFCELEFDIESDGVVNWMLWTDLPAGLFGERKTGTFAATGGRKTVPQNFTSQNIMGWRGRLHVWSDQEYQLHALRIRVLPVGEYIDGAQGDTWESIPF